MRRLAVAGLAAVTLWMASGPASAGDADYVVTGGPHTAERNEDGTTTLELTVSNLGDRELELRLEAGSVRCADVTGRPALEPYTSGDVTFSMACEAGGETREATLSPTTAGLSPVRVPVEFTVEPESESEWTVLWWFLVGALVAAGSVVVAYGFWFFHPYGNLQEKSEQTATQAGPNPGTIPDPVERAGPTVPVKETLREAWNARHPMTQLPSLTRVWDFKNDWSSNVGLGAALFTAVLANTDTLEAVVGEDATGPLSVVTVAAAMSTALVGTGPLWLVICKRRYEKDPAATHYTVGGVLVASLAVLWGSNGLIFSVAALVDLWQAWALAAVACGMLLLYTSKSIPMTLARGVSKHAEASGML